MSQIEHRLLQRRRPIPPPEAPHTRLPQGSVRRRALPPETELFFALPEIDSLAVANLLTGIEERFALVMKTTMSLPRISRRSGAWRPLFSGWGTLSCQAPGALGDLCQWGQRHPPAKAQHRTGEREADQHHRPGRGFGHRWRVDQPIESEIDSRRRIPGVDGAVPVKLPVAPRKRPVPPVTT